MEKTVSGLGGLDILVINAGRQQYREKIEDLSTDDFDKTMKTNLYALHWIAQAAVPHLPAGGSVITTASIQAYQPSPILLDYATTKAGIVAYTKALAKQLIERGIRANVVAPGPVWTALQPSGGQPDEKVENFGKDSDFGRPGQPVELAPVFVKYRMSWRWNCFGFSPRRKRKHCQWIEYPQQNCLIATQSL